MRTFIVPVHTVFISLLASSILAFIAPPSIAEHNVVDGCGSGPTGSVTPNGVFANFEPACNNHDRCYGKLGNSRLGCDNRFYNEMLDRCESTYSDIWEYPSLQACYANLELYYQAVRAFGGDAYASSQRHARQDQRINFYVTNNCRRSVRIAIRFRNRSGEWETQSWWQFSPGEGAYLSSNGSRLFTNNRIFYYYAEVTSGSSYSWSGDDKYYNVDGRRLGFREKRGSGNTLRVSLSCNNL